MLSEQVRARLALLRRTLRPVRMPAALPRDAGPASDPYGTAACPPDASGLPEGREVVRASGGHWLIEQTLESLWPAAAASLARGGPRLRQAAGAADDLPDELRELGRAFAHQVIFLDLETCGLSGAMIFLAGLLHDSPRGLLLTQLLARNYAEEQPLLESLWEYVAQRDVLVTFNGKSFDWPLIVDRSTLHRLIAVPDHRHRAAGAPPRDDAWHCDLLHHARRRWRGQLPNCRLQTLERYICGRHRGDDIPGSEIPAAYHDFVRTGQCPAMHAILRHNALDLVTLLQLALCIVP